MHRIIFVWVITFFANYEVIGNSWELALSTKHARLDLYWYTSLPFIYPDDNGQLIGLEYEICSAFQEYLEEKYEIELTLNWIEASSFYGILETIKSEKNENAMGVSALSITEERKQFVKYTEAYMPDITVLVSSQGTPIVHTFDEINKMMVGMTAITIKGTIYENMLKDLKNRLNINFEIKYIESDQNILDHVSQTHNSFCFIDLPIYLMWIKNGSALTRQNFFTVRGTGYGFIMPLTSDWDQPFYEFLTDPENKGEIAQIISKYIGSELYEFIGQLYEGEMLGTSLLTKEKEIQLALIKNANLKLEEEKAFKRILIIGIITTLFLLLIIGGMLYNNQKTTKLLLSQKEQIEIQQEDIHRKNDQLINRNTKLLALNEEKNNLINILAHDLRSPLGQIIGLSGLLDNSKTKMDNEGRGYLKMITETANRMNKMIIKILDVDALEGNQNAIMREPVGVNQILQDVAARFRSAASQKKIDLHLLKCNGDPVFDTDHLLLFLILENLVSNAVKFSPAQTQITLEAQYKKDEVMFKVSDQGPGFTDEDKLFVFNRFQKLSAKPTGNESSVGLGLSIVKKYVTDLGGKIWLESQTGQGSAFFVSLPI